MTSLRKIIEERRKPEPKAVVSVRLYKRIAATFIALSVFLFIFIVYLSFSKAVIEITPSYEKVSLDFTINLEKEPVQDESIRSSMSSIIVQGEITENVTGELGVGESLARGRVKIINLTSKDQVLVKTTRFLTEDQKLFRLEAQVVAPANGGVEANIYADKPGEEGIIESAKFIIPGLWPGLQDKIYAESLGKTEISQEKVKAITGEDLARAKEKLQNELLEKGRGELEKIMPIEFDGKEFAIEIVDEKFDGKIGDKKEGVRLQMKARIVGVFYETSGLRNFAKSKLEESASNDVEIAKINYENLKVSVARYDLSDENASFKAFIDGETILKSTSQIFDKGKLAGLDKEGVLEYFKNFKSVASVDVLLKPFWLKKIPELRDHIEIKIKR